MMRFNGILLSLLLSAVFFSACSEKEDAGNGQGANYDEGFRLLCTVDMRSGEGENENASGEFNPDKQEAALQSRSLSSVNDFKRPTTVYPLDYISMLKTDVKTQPKPEDVGKDTDLGNIDAVYEKHVFGNSTYDIMYNIVEDDKQYEGCTKNGKVTLKQKGKPGGVTFRLSLFELNKAGNESLQLNDFAYDKVSDGAAVRGSSLRFISYNPMECEQGVFLPEVKDQNIKNVIFNLEKHPEDRHKKLYAERKDDLFCGNELIFCATDEYLYVYQIKNKAYNLLYTFDRSNEDDTKRTITLNRLTAILNVSFILVDDDNDPDPYFVSGDMEQSYANFIRKYGLDIKTMTCPYASVDDIMTGYDINEKGIANTFEDEELLLWAPDYSVIDAKGQKFTPEGKLGELAFIYGDGKEARGIGIAGNSYSVIFKSSAGMEDNDIDIKFFTKIDGVNKGIVIEGETSDNFEIAQNKTNNIFVIVSAQKFAEFVKNPINKSRSGNNGYETFVVPSEYVIVK